MHCFGETSIVTYNAIIVLNNNDTLSVEQTNSEVAKGVKDYTVGSKKCY